MSLTSNLLKTGLIVAGLSGLFGCSVDNTLSKEELSRIKTTYSEEYIELKKAQRVGSIISNSSSEETAGYMIAALLSDSPEELTSYQAKVQENVPGSPEQIAGYTAALAEENGNLNQVILNAENSHALSLRSNEVNMYHTLAMTLAEGEMSKVKKAQKSLLEIDPVMANQKEFDAYTAAMVVVNNDLKLFENAKELASLMEAKTPEELGLYTISAAIIMTQTEQDSL
jgi:hypothetical protein